MRKQFVFIIMTSVIIYCFSNAYSAEARGMPAVELNLVPTAETLGKGGYSLSTGMFSYKLVNSTSKPIEIDVGGFFREKHQVILDSNIRLVPTRITYGISDNFDLMFGGTYSAGDADKIVSDYYETGDKDKKRVYPQMILDGVIGGKYKIQSASARLPAMAFGGEIQMGYTLDSAFKDKSLEDSYPFVAMQMHLLASYDAEIVNIHGGLGMFISSKSIQSSQKFDVPIQLGMEIPFDGFAAVVDVALFKAYSGIGLDNIVSAGIRYNISSKAMLNASVASVGGLLIRLTIGGEKPELAAPSAPTLF